MTALNDAIMILSLSVCVPLFGVYLETLILWYDTAAESFLKGVTAPGDRLARGIFIGFAADTLDNLYWFVTWSLVLLDYEFGLTMMLGGSAANLFFRQGLGLWAGYEHVTSAQHHHGRGYERRVFDVYYWVGGVLLALVLTFANDWTGG